MTPRIAIPVPHSADREYAERALVQYEQAIEASGAEPVRIPLDGAAANVMVLVAGCLGTLLPGSRADVDPRRFAAPPHAKTEPADLRREAVDKLLLDDAYRLRKPLLGICYGLQSLNVYRSGTLLQHIESSVNHEAGRKLPVAHMVAIEPKSKLGRILAPREGRGELVIPANSSHHQAADVVGSGLRIVARCPDDAVIEALEGTDSEHFVVAVQWHPERSFADDERSRWIFKAFIEAASERFPRHLEGVDLARK
ncbi:MAG: gamma-glutamyl-gamma-aminobutyrate hydrolase family protein [Acidobacteria bacterium]|nr:gamma-glutamyl-gamma-aminobutyrate hydrolase family protein [Acidobacteriota bacterium]MBV9625341.1 gamma-glutamyl-gamma-aminobutyrate hydrolase family protein [Acidobacteriota bacterium]